MRSIKLTSTLRKLVQENFSLSSYLRSLSRGREETPHSWLYENLPSETVLQQWIPKMESANNKSQFGQLFNQFDQKQIEKFGPQGRVPPISDPEVQDTIEPLFSPTNYDSEMALSHYFDKAHEFAEVAFGRRLQTKRPKSFNTVIDNMRDRDTLSTNSGFPRFKSRQSVSGMEIQDAITGKAYEYPAIILFRHYNGKLRPVWMFPMSMNLIEFQYAQVIQENLATSRVDWIRDYLTPWKGYDVVKQTLSEQWPREGPIVGGDTTKMDAHMRPAQIRLFFEIVKWLFQESFWDSLHRCLLHICDIPLLYSEKEYYVGIHGLASGSGWTQLTETVLQLFMAWDAGVVGQGIGDDFYWISDMDAGQLVDYLEKFGLPANPEKQSVSMDTLTFLQRLNHQGFASREDKACLGGYYPSIRALNSMLNPEKFHKPKDWDSDMFCIRNYMILENCVDNPCFDEFVKFVVKGQKDMIPFAQKKDSELSDIQKRSRLLPGLNPSYNQEKREKPLSSFASIKLAKRLQ